MPWDGAFPIGRGAGGGGPRAGLPGARPLAASRAPCSAPASGRGARRAGRGRGPRRGGPAGRAPAAGRVGARARGRVTECARASVCLCVCVSVCVSAREPARVCHCGRERARRGHERVAGTYKGPPGWQGAGRGGGAAPRALERYPRRAGGRGAGRAHGPLLFPPASPTPGFPRATREAKPSGLEPARGRGAPRGLETSRSPSPRAPRGGDAFGEARQGGGNGGHSLAKVTSESYSRAVHGEPGPPAASARCSPPPFLRRCLDAGT